jgi:hypothetical protein
MDYMGNLLESWRIFFGTVAASSATLMGLIFLSVSLHLDRFNQTRVEETRQIAWQTFINFFWVFTVGMIFLIPGLSQLGLGSLIALLGLAGIAICSRRWWRARKHLTTLRAIVAFVPLLVCYVGSTISGLLVSFWSGAALVIVPPVMIVLIGISVRDAWNLLVSPHDSSKV